MPKDNLQDVPHLSKFIAANLRGWLNSARTIEEYFEIQFKDDFNCLPPLERAKIAALYEANKIKETEIVLNHNIQSEKVLLERERVALEREKVELQRLALEKIENGTVPSVFQSPQDYFKSVGFEDLKDNLERSKEVENQYDERIKNKNK